jgi:hypothetical protein
MALSESPIEIWRQGIPSEGSVFTVEVVGVEMHGGSSIRED